MKSDLKQLIDYYNTQKDTFGQLLKDCLYLEDYLGAHHYSVVLDNIEMELKLLNFLRDPLYDDKQTLARMYRQAENDRDYMRDYWRQTIDGKKNKIKQLHEQKGSFVLDSQQIDEALFDLQDSKSEALR